MTKQQINLAIFIGVVSDLISSTLIHLIKLLIVSFMT
jgi:hypothetical protein